MEGSRVQELLGNMIIAELETTNYKDACRKFNKCGFTSIELIKDFKLNKKAILTYMQDHRIYRISDIKWGSYKNNSGLPAEYYISGDSLELETCFKPELYLIERISSKFNCRILSATVTCVSILNYLLENDHNPSVKGITDSNRWYAYVYKDCKFHFFDTEEQALQYSIKCAYELGNVLDIMTVDVSTFEETLDIIG